VVDQISTPVMLVVRMKGVLNQSKDTNNKTRGKESSSNADARAGDCVSSALALASAPPQMGPFSCAKTHTIPEESPVPPLLYCSHHRSGGKRLPVQRKRPIAQCHQGLVMVYNYTADRRSSVGMLQALSLSDWCEAVNPVHD